MDVTKLYIRNISTRRYLLIFHGDKSGKKKRDD